MDKAILVINMPESCKDCRLKYSDNGDDAYFGGVTERCVIDGSEIPTSGRHYDCPLRPLPKKKSVELACQKEEAGNEYGAGLIVGWNDCIRELEENE